MKKTILLICTIIIFSLNAFSQTKRQDVIDDGYTWFEAGNGQALGGNNIPYSTGWYLISSVKVLGEYPNRSAFKMVVSKSGKVIATTRCETGRYSNKNGAYDESYVGKKKLRVKKSAFLT
jgi:hypothetical protein